MDISIQQLIQFYQLLPHPEGGYYKETYRSSERIPADSLSEKFNGERNYSTAIYFLLEKNSFSAFHRIQSDECWHFYTGDAVDIHVLHTNGNYELIKLGSNIEMGEQYQAIVPAGAWFASKTNGQYSLVGCTVSPGFDFADFELAKASALILQYPNQEKLIKHFCRS
ncbi:cupin domain-containing protein [Sediminibacterium sp.]|uniref:cupin domain-containing protein n=1 Tax=Sediminibacterium sp. TaxID=1917865 RepID=UPI00273295D7|nr:cupin domain-containing protein [Sediminibacterium sp.]MDP3394051.1 cupin domain-containing protein [Sediminibacterium sp.]MDP3566360.1 cupin domain-containing protein [Sediminibacterium sp.]